MIRLRRFFVTDIVEEVISVSEYLATSFRPDCELIDGQLVERNVGEYDHSNLQGALVTWLRNRQRAWNIRVLPKQRIRIGETQFRIPDISVVSRDQAIEAVFTHPPLACIEILSKDDTLRSMQDRIDDYLELGVANIWILDPVSRRAYVCTRGGLQEPAGGVLEAAESGILILLDEVFGDLD